MVTPLEEHNILTVVLKSPLTWTHKFLRIFSWRLMVKQSIVNVQDKQLLSLAAWIQELDL